jgi:excisionase family DNA binding protein
MVSYMITSKNLNNLVVQRGAAKPLQVDRLLLRGGEVANMLGVSRALAFRWMQEGTLPTVRIPGARTVRVPQDALRDWISANTK